MAQTATAPTPHIHRSVREPATGARFLPGRVPMVGANNKDQILFRSAVYSPKVVKADDSTVAGSLFGPAIELPEDHSPDVGFKLADGARIIRAGATTDSRVVSIREFMPPGATKRRQYIDQFSLAKVGEEVVILPPSEDGIFWWEIWTGFYSLDQLEQARILMQNGLFLHGAGPFQGAGDFITGAASTTGLRKNLNKGLAEGLAEEVHYRYGVYDGVPLWQAFYFKARYSPKDSQGVLVRQLHQAHLLLCKGGLPEVKTFPADTFKHSYNDSGVPVQVRSTA